MTDSVARARVEWLAAGRVGRPHGLDGSFHVTRPRGALLALGTAVRVGDGEAEIVRRAGTDERPILRLAGHDGREAAEALRGLDLLVHRASAPELDEDEWYAEDLEGCRVVDGATEVGRVVQMVALPSCEALEVQRARAGRICSCRSFATRCARWTSRPASSTSTWPSWASRSPRAPPSGRRA